MRRGGWERGGRTRFPFGRDSAGLHKLGFGLQAAAGYEGRWVGDGGGGGGRKLRVASNLCVAWTVRRRQPS